MLPFCAPLQRWQIGWLQRKCKVSKQIQFFEKEMRTKHYLWKVIKHFQFLWTRVILVIDLLFILKVCQQFQFSWARGPNHDNQTRTIQGQYKGKYKGKYQWNTRGNTREIQDNDYDNILILGAGFHLLHQRIIQRSAKFNLNSVHIFKDWFLCNMILLCVIWYKIECPVFSYLSIIIDLSIFHYWPSNIIDLSINIDLHIMPSSCSGA